MNIHVKELVDGWTGQASTLHEADRIIESSDTDDYQPEWQVWVEVTPEVREALKLGGLT